MRETLKLALDALEKFRYYIANNYEINAAIVAAREALAQPEQEPVAHCTVRPLRGDEFYPKTEIIWVKGRPVAGPLYTTPPLVPEAHKRPSRSNINPLTADRKWKLTNAFWRMYGHGKNDNPVSAQCEVQALGMFLAGADMSAWKTSVVPPYAPTERQRKPLTDEQIDRICGDVGYGYISVARAIEAAHGIKENT